MISVADFIRTLFEYLPDGVGQYLEVRAFSEQGEKFAVSNWYDITDSEFNFDVVGSETVFANKRKFGCFLGYNFRNDKRGLKENVTRLAAVYADVDLYKVADRTPDEFRAAVLSCPLPPTMVVSSGGGFQLVWILSEISTDKELWRRAQVGVAEYFKEFGADGSVVTDESRVLRIPGTYNWKTGEPREVDLIGLPGNVWSLQSVVNHFPVDDDVFDKKVGRLGSVPEEINSGGGAEYEGRNTTLFKYGCLFREKGFKGAVIEAMLYSANQEHCNPPLDDAEVGRILDSVMKYDRGEKAEEIAQLESDRPRVLRSFGTMEDTVHGRPEEIFYGVNRREVTMVQAQPDVGKSTTFLNVAVSLACGRQFHNIVTNSEPRRVAYLDGENSEYFLNSDLKVMAASLTEREQRMVRENLSLMVDFDLADQEPKLTNKDHFEIILDELVRFDPDIIIIDTVASWFELKNENDNSEVEKKVGTVCKRIAKKCNAAVVILHHAGKSKDEKTFSAMYKGRGASAFQAFARTIINLDAVVDALGEQQDGAVDISYTKCKSKPKLRSQRFYVNRSIRWLTSEPWSLVPEQTDVAEREAAELLANCLDGKPGGITFSEFGTYCNSNGIQKTEAQMRAILDWAVREDFLIRTGYIHYPGIRLTRFQKERLNGTIGNNSE